MDVANVQTRLLKNSLLLGISRLLSICTSLISVPIIVTKLGLSGYGGWEAIMAITAISVGFQSAISGTLVWKMSEAYGNNDHAKLERLVRIGIGANVIAFLIICPLVWTMRFQLVNISNVPAMYQPVALWVLPWLVTQTALGSAGETFGAMLIAYQRAGVMTLIQSSGVVINNAIVVLCLINGWQLWSLLLGNTIGVASTIVGLYVAATKLRGEAINIAPLLPNWVEAKPLLRYAGLLAFGSISIILRDQTDKLVLANVGDSLWTAWLGMASRLANLVLVICSFFYVPLISAVAAMNARGDWAGVRKIYENVTIALPLLVGAFAVVIASTYDRLLVMWLGRNLPQVAPLLFILLAGNITAVVLTGAGSSLCKGIGRAGLETTYIIVCVVSNIALKFWLTWLMGPIGSVLSSAMSWALGSMIFIILLHRAVALPHTALRGAAAIPVMAAAVGIARLFAGALPQSTTWWHSAASFSAIGLLGVAVYVALLIATGITPLSILLHIYSVSRNAILPRRRVRYGF